jgi:hypothetical protein
MKNYTALLLLINMVVHGMQNNEFISIPASKAPRNTIPMNRFVGVSPYAASLHETDSATACKVHVNHSDHILTWAIDYDDVYYVKCTTCKGKPVILIGNKK